MEKNKENLLIESITAIFHDIENYHDAYLKEHEIRTGNLMSLLGKSFGLSNTICLLLDQFGSIHDIGKLAISESILEKSSQLTVFEKKIIEMHPMVGYHFIKDIKHPDADLAGIIILTHHECYDGTGYPRGLAGENIPIEGYICSICDVYDALRSRRSYHEGLSHEKILKLMCDTSDSGLYNKFHPKLMEVFLDVSSQVNNLYTV